MSAGTATAGGPTLWLSCHVRYACRHAGACCRSGWPLPVETQVVPAIDAAIAAGRLRTVDGKPVWFLASAAAPPGMAGTFRLVGDGCVFHAPGRPGEAAASRTDARHCAVHAAAGHAALPASCQHFPRVCLVDARGVRVSLSHYCPTAASLLCEHEGPVEVVAGPPAVPGTALPEGLDARAELPPRLTSRVLIDLESLTAWEHLVVQILAGPDAPAGTPTEALALLRAYAEELVMWTPGDVPLAQVIEALRGSARTAGAAGSLVAAERRSDGEPYRLARRRRAMRMVTQTCRAPWTWPATPANVDALDRAFVAPAWGAATPVVRRYLAAKAFGAWVTYQADAARGLVRWLQLAHDVLRVEAARACGEANRSLDRDLLFTAVRQADLLLTHYADGLAVARSL